MLLSAATLQVLHDKGITGQDLIDVYAALENDFRAFQPVAPAAHQESTEDRRRRLDRERKAKLRSADKADNSADNSADKADTESQDRPQKSAEVPQKSADIADISPPLARVRDKPSRLVITGVTEDTEDAGANASADDWPKVRVVETLVAEIASPRLDLSKSPKLVETSGRLAAWKRAGASWQFDVIPVVKALTSKATNPIRSWDFFRDAIAESITANRRALTLPEARPHERTRPDRRQCAFTDRLGDIDAAMVAAFEPEAG